MEEKKIDIEAEIFGIPEEVPLFRQTKIKGSAKVVIKNFGITLRWISWAVSHKKVRITFPAVTRIVDGKKKKCPSFFFTDKKLDKLVCRLIKYKVLLKLEELEKLAIEQKKKTKEEAKRKEKFQKFAELRAFFGLPEDYQGEILWDLWLKSYRKPKKKKEGFQEFQGEKRRPSGIPSGGKKAFGNSKNAEWVWQVEKQVKHAEGRQKFEIWKKNRLKQMRESFSQFKEMFEGEIR